MVNNIFNSRRVWVIKVVFLIFHPLHVSVPVRINDRGDPLRWLRDTLYPQKLAQASPTSGGRSVGIVRLRTKGQGI
jgi:hypothetical protein